MTPLEKYESFPKNCGLYIPSSPLRLQEKAHLQLHGTILKPVQNVFLVWELFKDNENTFYYIFPSCGIGFGTLEASISEQTLN